MSGKVIVKILLDIVMTVLYLMLMFAGGMDDFFHEVVGIGIAVLFVFHVAINIKPLTSMLRAVKSGKSNLKVKIMLALNILLILGMPIVIVTGLMISKVILFTGISSAWMTIFNIHFITSYVCLALLGFHLAVHAKYLIKAVSSIIKNINSKSVRKTIGKFIAGAFAASLAYVLAFQMYKLSTTVIAAEPDQTDTDSAASTTEEIAENSTSASVLTDGSIITDNDVQYDEQTIDSVAEETTSISITETLNEFLGKMYCTLCHNHCALSNPRCGRSASLIEDATEQYNELYS